jgi:hypothetical protein
MPDFLVKRDDLRECRIAASAVSELEPGQALLRVDRFGLTANNITYAVLGEAMSYWSFFPAGDGWGRVPMWGFAEVERSAAEGLSGGERVYGYLPPSSHLVVRPEVDARGFVDISEHRAPLPPVYQRYELTGSDPFYRPDSEDLQALLRGLFFTSFLIDDQLADEGLIDRGPVIISSASAKTAIAAAFMLARRDGVELVGLTSAANAGFVDGLRIYDQTVTYDAIASLDRGPATLVDIAGDADVRRAVHSHYGDSLAANLGVGLTHWEEFGVGGGELPGPTPTFFFAPARFAKRAQDWGAADLMARVTEAWHPFCEWTRGWLEVIHGAGFDAIQSAYLDVLEHRVGPGTAHVLTPAPGTSL